MHLAINSSFKTSASFEKHHSCNRYDGFVRALGVVHGRSFRRT